MSDTAMVKIDLTQVGDLILKGIECWVEAGEIVAAALDAEPDCMDRICTVTGLSADIVRRFEQIGRREIYPKLLANTGVGFIKLSACSYREQKLYSENPIPLAIQNDDGSMDTLQVLASNMTASQVKQSFAKNHVRDLSEQRAWLESERKRQADKALRDNVEIQDAAFVIKGHRVIFRKGCELTASELAQLLAKVS